MTERWASGDRVNLLRAATTVLFFATALAVGYSCLCASEDPLDSVPEYFVGFASRNGAQLFDKDERPLAEKLVQPKLFTKDSCITSDSSRVVCAACVGGDTLTCGWVRATDLEFCPTRFDASALERQLRRKGLAEDFELENQAGTMVLRMRTSPFDTISVAYTCVSGRALPLGS